MKTYIVFSASILTVIMLSCQDKGTVIESPTKPQPYHHGYYVSGQIVISFVDSVDLSEAESFVRGFGLTPINFTSFETDPLRPGIIGVPIGMEQFWADSLNTYPSFVRRGESTCNCGRIVSAA